jgi:hypothetical protein
LLCAWDAQFTNHLIFAALTSLRVAGGAKGYGKTSSLGALLREMITNPG